MPSRAFSFLAALCHAAFAGDAKDKLGHSSSELDWARLVRLARFHRVQGLAWKGLLALGTQAPIAAVDTLAEDARKIAVDNLQIAVECRSLARAFGDSGISILFVKGLTLAALAYGDCSTKAGIDIDLLVAASDLSGAAEILARSGYRLAEPAPKTSPKALIRWHRARKESLWVNPDKGLKVDLHTRLADNPRLIPTLSAGSARQLVSIADGLDLPTLGDEELFAYLAVHGASSVWFRLKWLTDLAAFAHRLGLERIERFYRRSQELGAGRASAQGLLLANRIYGVLGQSPSLARELRADRVNVWLERVAFNRLAGKIEPVHPTASFLGTAPMHYTPLVFLPGGAFALSELARQLRMVLTRR